jgi:hypothetical protein
MLGRGTGAESVYFFIRARVPADCRGDHLKKIGALSTLPRTASSLHFTVENGGGLTRFCFPKNFNRLARQLFRHAMNAISRHNP